MTDHEPPNPQLAVPIAQLGSQVNTDGQYVNGLINLVWPYSSSRRESNLLLVEPDFRLRRANGQVRIVFKGASAKAIARANVNSGDSIRLWLDGAQYERAETTIATPGKGIEWDLRFYQRLRFRVQKENQEALSVTVDNPTPSPGPSPPLQVTATDGIDVIRRSTSISTKQLWDSPAFLKRKRISSLPFFESSYDPFSIDPETDPQPLPKKSKFGRKSGEWKFAERTPSPESIIAAEDVTRSPTEAQHSDSVTPSAQPDTAYITAPPSEEEAPVETEDNRKNLLNSSLQVKEAATLEEIQDFAGPDTAKVANVLTDSELPKDLEKPGLSHHQNISMEGAVTTPHLEEAPQVEVASPGERNKSQPSHESTPPAEASGEDNNYVSDSTRDDDREYVMSSKHNLSISDREEISTIHKYVKYTSTSDQESSVEPGVSDSEQSQPAEYDTDDHDETAVSIDVNQEDHSASFGLDGTAFSRFRSQQRSSSPPVSRNEEDKFDDSQSGRMTDDLVEPDTGQHLPTVDSFSIKESGRTSESREKQSPKPPQAMLSHGNFGDYVAEQANLLQDHPHPIGLDQPNDSIPDTGSFDPHPIPDVAPPLNAIKDRDDQAMTETDRLPFSVPDNEYLDTTKSNGEEIQEKKSGIKLVVVEDSEDVHQTIIGNQDQVELRSLQAATRPSDILNTNTSGHGLEAQQQHATDDDDGLGAFVSSSQTQPHAIETEKVSQPSTHESSSNVVRDIAPNIESHVKPAPIHQFLAEEAEQHTQASVVEVIELEEDSDDEQEILASLQRSYVHASIPDDNVKTEVTAPSQLMIHSDHPAEAIEAPSETPVTRTGFDLESGRHSMAFEVLQDQQIASSDEKQMRTRHTPEPQVQDTYNEDSQVRLNSPINEERLQPSVDNTEPPNSMIDSVASFDPVNDLQIPVWDEAVPENFPPDPTLEMEVSAQIPSSPPPYIPEDDFWDMSRYSDDEPQAPLPEAVAPALAEFPLKILHQQDQESSSSQKPTEVIRPSPQDNQVLSAPASLDPVDDHTEDPVGDPVDESMDFPADDRGEDPDLPGDDQANGRALRDEINEVGDKATPIPKASDPEIPIDPSLIPKPRTKTQVATPAPTQQTALASEASRLSIRSLSPALAHLPTPSLTQGPSNEQLEQLPEPETPKSPRSTSVIEKLKSRSAESKKKRFSDIAPVVSPWFAPKRSSQVVLDREESSRSLVMQRSSQVSFSAAEPSSQIIPDSEDEAQEDIGGMNEREEASSDEAEHTTHNDEELNTISKSFEKSRRSPIRPEPTSPSHKHPPPSSQSLPGLRTPLSYFAPLSTLSSHFSTTVSTLSVLVSRTNPERAKKGLRDFTTTLYLSDPSLHQGQPSSAMSPQLPTSYFKPSKSPRFTITAMIFRPHASALPQAEQGDSILLRNFKVTSLKGKMGLTSSEGSAWAVFRRGKGWDPEIRGPPVEFGPEERAYAKGLGRWWDVVRAVYEKNKEEEEKADGMEGGFSKKQGGRNGMSRKGGKGLRSSPSPSGPPLKHELRDGKEYVDDPEAAEEAKAHGKDVRRSTHVLRDGHTYRDDV